MIAVCCQMWPGMASCLRSASPLRGRPQGPIHGPSTALCNDPCAPRVKDPDRINYGHVTPACFFEKTWPPSSGRCGREV